MIIQVTPLRKRLITLNTLQWLSPMYELVMLHQPLPKLKTYLTHIAQVRRVPRAHGVCDIVPFQQMPFQCIGLRERVFTLSTFECFLVCVGVHVTTQVAC